VQANPAKLAARHLDLETVRQALAAGSVNMPAGSLYGLSKAYTVDSTSQLSTAQQFRKLIVTYQNGSPVYLDQLGKVLNSVENTKSEFWINGHPSIILAVNKQPGSNTVAVADAVQALLPQMEKSMPAGVVVGSAFDASQEIRASITDVKVTLIIAIVLVIGVIFFFLRNASATAIPSVAVPLSLLGTFAAMYLLGFTVDMLSMMAMILSVGFVVDDAIVMLENIVRHLEMGKTRMQAAIDGAREIGFTIVSMTLSLVAVFIPVLFMTGIIGRLLREFSITIAVAVLISGFVSLTLTPMLCSRFLRPESERRQGWFYRTAGNVIHRLTNSYGSTLHVVLRHKAPTLIVAILLTIATGYMFVVMPKGFMPTVDTGFAFGGSQAAQDTSFDEMVRLQKKVNAIVAKNPWVQNFGSGAGNGGQNQGFLFMVFKDTPNRPKASVILAQLEQQFAEKIPGLMVFLQVPPLIQMGQHEGRAQYSLALQDADTKELYHWAPILDAKLRSLPSIATVYMDLYLDTPRLNVNIDRNRAQALGVSPSDIANTLYDAYGNRKVGTITTSSNQYEVILEVLPKDQRDPAALNDLYIRSSTGKMVPLSAVATITQTVAPLSVNHIGQLPAVDFQFNLKPGVALSDATKQISQAAAQIGMPDTVSFSYQGTAAAFEQSLRNLGILLLIAVVVIYLVLGILYESFIHPITILSGLPSAGLGALITLLIFNQTLNLYSFVGNVLLIGIVQKNAIMMIDFALDAQRRENRPPQEAIFEGAMKRFRPIIMTTMAAFIGTLPIVVGTGPGGEARRPLGIAVCGGLIVSQLLTLYITPVVYVYLDRFQNWRKRRREAVPAGETEVLATR
jgi:HAE1 family hydrophobic/amphiphilic exporter-1